MPVRATKRGAERTPLNGDFDVVICGASFAGLAVARELSGSGAKVLLIDRYEVGERQTSACAAPTRWLDRRYVRAGYSWSFPAGEEVRVGVGSFDPHDKVKEPTVELAGNLGVEAVRYQGNWIPHRIRPAAEGDVFFCGDSAGHCLPTTA